MTLTKTQLDILKLVYTEGSVTSREASTHLKYSHEYISSRITDLKQKGFLKKQGTIYSISDNIHSYSLRNLFLEHPQTNFKEILADSRAEILILLFNKKTMKRIKYLTGLSKPLIYRYLRDFQKYAIVIKQGEYYKLNRTLWPELIDFLENYSKYQEILTNNLPAVCRKVHKSKDFILFEAPPAQNIDKKTATKTAFSQFGRYGIPLRLRHNYYCMPPKNLNINDIFAHAILCSMDLRKKTYTILFYLRNKESLDIQYISERYKLKISINKIEAILKGRTIKDYPALEEIKQKADLYDIRY